MEKQKKHVLTQSDLRTDLGGAFLGGHPLLAIFVILGCTLSSLGVYIGLSSALVFIATLPTLFFLLLSAYMTVYLILRYAYYKRLIHRLSVFIDREPSPLYNTEVYYRGGGRGSPRKSATALPSRRANGRHPSALIPLWEINACLT